jgi:hypothetical protein
MRRYFVRVRDVVLSRKLALGVPLTFLVKNDISVMGGIV